MKILNKEIEFDFNDADDMEKLENAVGDTEKKLNNLQITNKKVSEAIRETCKCIFDCFDKIFEIDSKKDIFNNKYNLNMCLEAFENLAQAKIEQENIFEERTEKIITKYSPNRVTERSK